MNILQKRVASAPWLTNNLPQNIIDDAHRWVSAASYKSVNHSTQAQAQQKHHHDPKTKTLTLDTISPLVPSSTRSVHLFHTLPPSSPAPTSTPASVSTATFPAPLRPPPASFRRREPLSDQAPPAVNTRDLRSSSLSAPLIGAALVP